MPKYCTCTGDVPPMSCSRGRHQFVSVSVRKEKGKRSFQITALSPTSKDQTNYIAWWQHTVIHSSRIPWNRKMSSISDLCYTSDYQSIITWKLLYLFVFLSPMRSNKCQCVQFGKPLWEWMKGKNDCKTQEVFVRNELLVVDFLTDVLKGKGGVENE